MFKTDGEENIPNFTRNDFVSRPMSNALAVLILIYETSACPVLTYHLVHNVNILISWLQTPADQDLHFIPI